MINIAFVDCETTHLSAEIGEAWEVAVILREQDGDQTTDTEYVWEFSIDPETVDPDALRIGRWHERRQLPARTDQAAFTGSVPAVPMSRPEAVAAIVNVLRGAVLVGSNPGFDDRFLRKLLGPGSAQWYYRPYDIVQLAAAKIGAQAAGPLPWRTHILSRAVGVEPPTEEAAHTALGDARWARDVHDAVMVREKFPLSWEGRAQHAIGLYTKTAVELEDARRELSASTATASQLRERHKDSLRRADEINNELMAEVQRYAEGTEQPVLWSVYNRMHIRAANAEAAVEHASKLASKWSAACTYGNAWIELREALAGPSQPVMTGETVCTCTFAEACGCNPDGIRTVSAPLSTKGLLVHESAVGLIDEIRGYSWNDEDTDEDRAEDEPEETGDADGDVFELISEIAGRLRDATDEGEYHAVGLIVDLANGCMPVAEARAALAEITFRHV